MVTKIPRALVLAALGCLAPLPVVSAQTTPIINPAQQTVPPASAQTSSAPTTGLTGNNTQSPNAQFLDKRGMHDNHRGGRMNSANHDHRDNKFQSYKDDSHHHHGEKDKKDKSANHNHSHQAANTPGSGSHHTTTNQRSILGNSPPHGNHLSGTQQHHDQGHSHRH